MNRRFQQPLTLLPELYRGVAIQFEAMAQAASIDDLFARLEREGIFLRLDPRAGPTMFRGAVVSEGEVDVLRRVEGVIRMGHVRRIERDAIVLDGGSVPTGERTVHVHCAARGLGRPPVRPIFEPGRVTIQPFLWGFACYQFATIGVVETLPVSDDEKNRLCTPMLFWDVKEDYASAFLATLAGNRARAAHPELAAFNEKTRLNPVSGLTACKDDPRVVDARARIKQAGAAAAANLQKLLSSA
jgi:hypothetical protein